jgi:hypothetical protein
MYDTKPLDHRVIFIQEADRLADDSPQAQIVLPLARLHLRPTAPLWAAQAVYRAAMQRAYPDHGGDHATACALTEAISVIREHNHREDD